MIRQGKELREAGLLEEDEKVSSLFEDEEQIKPLAGEAYMKEITQEEVEVIEAELSRLAETILKDWRRRQKQSKLEQVAGEVLEIAETVGSMMNNNIGNGRYLNPSNFSKEMCLEYNLGPQVC